MESTMKRILLRVPNWIGDGVLSLPAVSALRAHSPEAEITAVAHRRLKDIFELAEEVDRVVPFDPPGRGWGLVALRRFSRELRDGGYDLGIAFPLSFSSALMLRWGGARERVGYSAEGRWWLLTKRVVLPKDYRERHLVDSYLELVRCLGVIAEERVPKLALGEEDLRKADHLLGDFGSSSLLVGIAPGATYGPAKRWPLRKFGELAQRLTGELGAKVVLLGNVQEAMMGGLGGEGENILDLMGETSLKEVCTVLKRCSLFVSNDSGLMHLAAALGTPVVAIFGSTSPRWTAPLGQGHIVIKRDLPCSPCFRRECPSATYECLGEIEVDQVLAEVKGSLDALKLRQRNAQEG